MRKGDLSAALSSRRRFAPLRVEGYGAGRSWSTDGAPAEAVVESKAEERVTGDER